MAEAILPRVEEIARAFSSEVTLLQAVRTYGQVLQETRPAASMQSPAEIDISMDIARQQAENETRVATEYLAAVRQDLESAGLRVQTMVMEGSASAAVLDYAKQANVDLIAMSTHGRSGISRLIAGSVADQIIRHSHIPILLIRPGG